MKVIASSNFMPSIGYFKILQDSELFCVDLNENFQKQTSRNRCSILTSQGVKILTVPVLKSSKNNIIKDSLIDNSTSWNLQMLKTIKSAYGKSPFFEYYFDNFQTILSKRHDKLVELNEELMTMCLKCLKIKRTISNTVAYKSFYDDYFDIRERLICDFGQIKRYQQVFGNKFVNNLSIVDVLMNEGPNATNILNESIIVY